MPGAASSYLLLVAMPFVPSSVLVPEANPKVVPIHHRFLAAHGGEALPPSLHGRPGPLLKALRTWVGQLMA